jgi:hypothetical protein
LEVVKAVIVEPMKELEKGTTLIVNEKEENFVGSIFSIIGNKYLL